MSSDALYMNDSYMKEWESTVEKADKKFIVLDKTAFYPKSGGQPWDEGEIINTNGGEVFKVVFVGKFSGSISHEVDKEGLQPGDKVKCRIDWDRRYKFMRMHTAAHVLSGIVEKETGALITGNQLGEDRSRLDLNIENFDKEKFIEYVRMSNELISKDLPVKVSFMPRDDALKDKDLFKLAGVDPATMLPPSVKEVRIVDIVG
ncbi:alanine--tRNA ligase-related protein, partial [Candidatus Aenigmatarchaeota archaeon]